MAYRDIVYALAARLEVLEAEVGDRTRERDEVARTLAEANAHARHEEYVAAAPRRARRRRLVLLAIALLVVVVGGVLTIVRALHREPHRLEQVIERMDRYSDQLCACTDTTCVQRVTDDMAKWARQQPIFSEKIPSGIDEPRIQVISTRMTVCVERAMRVQPPAAQ